MENLVKLNLGCGKNLKPGYVNVDKYGTPDQLHDLETFPWPWDTSSIGEIVLNHVLEHLGQSTETFLGIIKELYRVSAPGALIHITVPHPRSDDFMNDPTHVRVITPEVLSLFSKKKNVEWINHGCANSPLGLYLGIDLEAASIHFILDEPWHSQFSSKQITDDEARLAMRRYNNVVKEIRMTMKVIKIEK